MTVALVILSDIHFTVRMGHPIGRRTDAIASAITTTSHDLESVVLLLSGDIANGGLPEEFSAAVAFLDGLKSNLVRRLPQVHISTLAVPGNHDCLLPKEGIEHRLSRVNSSLKTIKEPSPDELFLKDLLSVQDNFWSFACLMTDSPAASLADKLCQERLITTASGAIKFNLLNSALLSQRHEDKAGLYLPVEYFRNHLTPSDTAALSISVLHHPSYWIEPTTFTALRQILNKLSDLVVTGHEHFSAAYKQVQSSGEEVAFYESPALYDSNYPTASAFRTLVLDLQAGRQKDILFRWKEGMYRHSEADSSDWKPLAQNEFSRSHQFDFNADHLRQLEDTGIAYSHPTTAKFKLSDVFVYPNLRVAKSKGEQELIKGGEVLGYISGKGTIHIQGGTFSGKSALAKQVTLHLNTHKGRISILLSGRNLDNVSPEEFLLRLTRAYKQQYANPDTDAFLQLDPSQRAIIIDDWHLARLSDEQRGEIHKVLSQFAGCSLLLVDDIFRLTQYATDSTTGEIGANLTAVQAEIVGLSYVSRGVLIANWYRLRREVGSAPPELDNSVKKVEDRISRLLGKESLPPYAFFVLCMLQASENKKLENTAGGSFGAYHEVLITTALTRGNLNDSLFEGKTALCSEIAHYLWVNGVGVLSEATVKAIAGEFAQKHLFSLQVDALLRALVEARVLELSDGHYRFAYSQFYYYFVAWYIRQHQDTEESVRLRGLVDQMIDSISSVENSSIVMFLIYFAVDRTAIISRLLKNADAIFAEAEPAKLEADVEVFEFRKEYLPSPHVPEDPNISLNRAEERVSKDRYEDDHAQKQRDHYEAFSYDEGLSEAKKIHLAEKNIEALGQVVRSFSASLPGSIKVSVLKATYSLGMRAMGHLLGNIARYLEARAGELRGEVQDWRFADDDRSITEMLEQIDQLMLVIGKAIAIHYTRKISDSVGVADNELAYSKAFESLENNAALKLIDSAIQMDHSRSFPEEVIEKRLRELKGLPFASSILDFLMARHVLLFKMETATRRRIARMAGWNAQRVEEASRTAQKLL